VQSILASAPEAFTVAETHVFSGYIAAMRDLERSHRARAGGRLVGLPATLDGDQCESMFSAVARLMMEGLYADAPQGDEAVWIEKTPLHVHHGREILDAYPDAFFIHVYRDPRAVFASMKAAREWAGAWLPRTALAAADRWHRDVDAGLRLADLTSNCLQVSYEDLQERRTESADRLADSLGIRLSGQETTDPEWSDEPAGFRRTGATDAWRNELTKLEVATVERHCGDLMSGLGYAPSTTAPAVGWLGVARDRLVGRARQAAHAIRRAG
jgi:Sulfotransferase family